MQLRDLILLNLKGFTKAGEDRDGTLFRHQDEDDALQARAMEVLDRVQIIRAFDLAGAMEAVHEVKDSLERQEKEQLESNMPGSIDMREAVRDRAQEERLGTARERHIRPQQKVTERKMEIPDSEDEDEDEEDGEQQYGTTQDDNSVDEAEHRSFGCDGFGPHEPTDPATRELGRSSMAASRGKAMIVVDTITNVVSPMMRANHVQGT